MVDPIFAGRPNLNWKAGTPGNFYGHGDSVSPAFGDIVMYDPRVNAPSGDPAQSNLTVNLPAISVANHGKSIEVHCMFDETVMTPSTTSYLDGRAGRTSLFPAGDDVIQDMDEYYVGPYAYYYSPAWYAGILIRQAGGDARKRTFQGPYTLKVTSAPAASGDAYATGRWICESRPMAMSRKRQASQFVGIGASPIAANDGDKIFYTGSGAVQVDLPANPDVGAVVEVFATGPAGTASITVNRNTRNINGQASNDTIDQFTAPSGITPLGFARYEFAGGPEGWLITNKYAL